MGDINENPNQKAVLIVDDDPTILELVKDILVTDFYVVHGAASGKAALDVLEEKKIDLIIADIMLSAEMSGHELCKTIKGKEKTAKIPVLMLSARKEMDDKLNAVDAGADDYMVKPFSPEELVKRVKLNMNLHF